MKYQRSKDQWLIRLNKGEFLIESLTKFVQNEQIKGAWISGLGGALWAELGFYELAQKQYHWKKFEKLLEITSLQGNIAWKDAQSALHIHGTFTDENMQAIGGHVKELAVSGTCELLLHHASDVRLTRSHDEAIGLALLDVGE